MRIQKLFRALVLLPLLSGIMTAVSCSDDNSEKETGKVSEVSGTVYDTQGNTLADVNITLRKTGTKRELEDQTTSASDGTFQFGNVRAINQLLTFEKEGYSLVGITVPSNKLLAGAVVLRPVLEYAAAKISGRVLDAQNGNVPFQGVTVSNGTKSVTTGADGSYLFESLTIQDYTLSFSMTGCTAVTKKLTADMFTDGVINVEDIALGGKELLPGLTLNDLKAAPCWYVNEYRGGASRGGGRIDWSTSFMSAQFFSWVGKVQMQNEGCTLRLKSWDSGKKDLENFDSFTYGRKFITEDNKIMSVNARCHQATAEVPVKWGVQVIDLTEVDPSVDLIGGVQEHPSGSYLTFEFDLSDYVGKEVIVAIGHFRDSDAYLKNQFAIAHVSFAPERTEGDEYLPGEEIPGLEGWHLTKEMVRSSMPNPVTEITGCVPSDISIDPKKDPCYHPLSGTGHIVSEWAFQYVNKDIEPTPKEGIVIKSRNKEGVQADYALPESFFYSKLKIYNGHNKVTFRVRNFSATVPTVFKVTVINDDCSPVFLSPVSYTAQSASATENGCWLFINEAGSPDSPKDYAEFTYDLSAYNGQNVMVCLGIHKADNPGGEEKLCIYNISIQ